MNRKDSIGSTYENDQEGDNYKEEGFDMIPDLPISKRLKRKVTIWFNYGTKEYFIRKNSYARLLQLKYFFKDYVLKSKYKEIEYRQEFQQELTFVLPFAYWHFKNGTLSKTISCKDTRELYFFSENHEEKFETRIDQLPKESYEIPNMYHCVTFDTSKWEQVPLKEHYKNDLLVFDKPLLLIANKYNTEWNSSPINFFSIKVLDKILIKFRHKYQIVYNRPKFNRIVGDNSGILNLNETEFIRSNYPDVILADDLFVKNQNYFNNYNHFQLMLYANCERFLSVHGGSAALASSFGGKNIILSRRGYEHRFNEFNTIFTALSGAEIYHAKEDKEVLELLDRHF